MKSRKCLDGAACIARASALLTRIETNSRTKSGWIRQRTRVHAVPDKVASEHEGVILHTPSTRAKA
ncbi:MAG: hypothetical protein LC754_03350 [Acidobacteria bacterium]|nr:hypothetical protein [Acidobacteriota bacterium]